MARFLADENLESYLLAELSRRLPSIDIVSVRSVGLAGTDDLVILQWAADNNRLVVTRDVSTMSSQAYGRVRAGLVMPGVVIVPSTASVRDVLDGLEALALYSQDNEWDGQVLFVGSPPIS